MNQRRVINTAGAPAPVAPYNQAMVGAGLVYTVGVVGSDPANSQLIGGRTAAEAEQALRNLRTILEAAGSGLHRVLKITIFLTDMAEVDLVNEIYAREMPQPYPARTTVAVRELPGGFRVEIDCIALAD